VSARVVAVVVTWNRRDLLLESLAALRAQTLRPVEVVVVDNASTDGTTELLRSEHGDLQVVHLTNQIQGGSDMLIRLTVDAFGFFIRT